MFLREPLPQMWISDFREETSLTLPFGAFEEVKESIAGTLRGMSGSQLFLLLVVFTGLVHGMGWLGGAMREMGDYGGHGAGELLMMLAAFAVAYSALNMLSGDFDMGGFGEFLDSHTGAIIPVLAGLIAAYIFAETIIAKAM